MLIGGIAMPKKVFELDPNAFGPQRVTVTVVPMAIGKGGLGLGGTF